MPVEVLGAVATVDLRQPAQGLGGIAQVAGRLAHAGRQRPGRDRSAVDRDRPVGRPDRLGELAVGLEVPGQLDPALRRTSRDAASSSRRIAAIRAASRPAAWSFFTRASRTATRCSSRIGEPGGGGELGLGVVELAQPVQVFGQLQPQVEVVLLEPDRLVRAARSPP